MCPPLAHCHSRRSMVPSVPVYQLGVNSVCFTGEILMSAGLPGELVCRIQPCAQCHCCCLCSQVLYSGRLDCVYSDPGGLVLAAHSLFSSGSRGDRRETRD